MSCIRLKTVVARHWFAAASAGVFIAGVVAARLVVFAGTNPFGLVPREPHSDERADGGGRTAPLRVPPTVGGLIPASDRERREVADRVTLRPGGFMSVSDCLHWLRVHGRNPERRSGDFQSFDACVRALTDDEAGQVVFGTRPLARTAHGLQYQLSRSNGRRDPSQEAHRDQCLATLGELGVPLTDPVRVNGESLTVRDLLADSVANFHLGQRELPWTLLAYALYLPPTRTWTNRYGESFDFDAVAREVMRQRPETSSCGGAHLAFSLAILARADAEVPVLSPAARAALAAWLERVAMTIRRTQRPDGAWPPDWCRELTPDGAPDWRPDVADEDHLLLATGHLAEVALYLPPDLRPHPRELVAAGSWLSERLKRTKILPGEKMYCPASHATAVLLQLFTAGGTPGRPNAPPAGSVRPEGGRR